VYGLLLYMSLLDALTTTAQRAMSHTPVCHFALLSAQLMVEFHPSFMKLYL
jgi:hypothetical protein